MSVDVIGNFLTNIRNGIAASKRSIEAPHSNMKEQLARILKEEGFIVDYMVSDEDAKKVLKVVLKYKGAESVIHEIVRVSTPGRRTFGGYQEILPVVGGLGITILSTSRGLLTNKEAKQHLVGGEIVCTVW
ncbi:MAG: 30S ribosomal protein S8 [candidate division TM6 bacterium GW2011_GWE2_41_16]|nr:MAG: 30S ribosomal protein S8 [candidate division TM6 bacterium GW2011_GWE2_41_16]